MDSILKVHTDRFNLRLLTPEDVNESYLNWFKDVSVNRYIAYAESKPDLQELRNYVEERCDRNDVLFLGIFDKKTNAHIGNIKFEPIDSLLGYAILGILIGDKDWRGKGVAGEVISACARYLFEYKNINQIILGVSCDNHAAITAYKKIGFIEKKSEFLSGLSDENVCMILNSVSDQQESSR